MFVPLPFSFPWSPDLSTGGLVTWIGDIITQDSKYKTNIKSIKLG